MNVLADLAAEHAALNDVLHGLDDVAWRTPTPAEGWDVRDTVAHLAWSEELARLALGDPGRFATIVADPGPAVEAWIERGRSQPGADVLRWWQDARRSTIALLADRADGDRVPWGAGPMSPTSFATARLMETWAHGQDVHEALGLPPAATDRLRHVAELGVRTRPFSYRVRGLSPPTTEIRVELDPPGGGQVWAWGPAAAPDAVRGPALDLCLVVTQRRHPDDTGLVVTGMARDWLLIAQAFAGPPTGPRPVQRR